MTRATGGSACAATSTRSRLRPYAYSRASSVVLIPSWPPFSSIRRTRGTRIWSLTRVCGSGRRGGSLKPRRGLKSWSPSCLRPPSEMKKPLSGSGGQSPQPARLNLRSSTLGGERRFRPCLPGFQVSKTRPEINERFRRLPAPALPDGECLVALLVAVDDRERHLVDLGVADPLADRLVRIVDLDAVRRELPRELVRRVAVVEPDREHAHLHRREPEGKRPRVVLDDDADEALERPEERTVDHEHRVLGVVGADVGQAEAGRHLPVELDRP